MAVFNEPTKWAQTLGQDADVVAIPDTSGETDPSIDKIFPSVFSIPLAQGGRAIPRSVLNGLFKLLGDWCFYQQNGGVASYSSSFDYTVGSFVKYNDEFYRCIQANGASSPKAPTNTSYWAKILNLADLTNNDTAKIAIVHNAMPSSKRDNLTVGASQTEYTAPSDGYFVFKSSSTATSSANFIGLNNTTSGVESRCSIAQVAYAQRVFVPCSKGDAVKIQYGGNSSEFSLAFVYANGSISEQV